MKIIGLSDLQFYGAITVYVGENDFFFFFCTRVSLKWWIQIFGNLDRDTSCPLIVAFPPRSVSFSVKSFLVRLLALHTCNSDQPFEPLLSPWLVCCKGQSCWSVNGFAGKVGGKNVFLQCLVSDQNACEDSLLTRVVKLLQSSLLSPWHNQYKRWPWASNYIVTVFLAWFFFF